MERLLIAVVIPAVLYAQAPTGTIRGTVTDSTGAVIPMATVGLANRDHGLSRMARAGSFGEYVFPALAPGQYEVQAGATGFSSSAKTVTLPVGGDLALDFNLRVAEPDKETISVEAETAAANPTAYSVDGVVSREQISNLPLNGRNALELARLEPAVLVSSGVPLGHNAFVDVSIGGQIGARTRITIDGGSVTDFVNGGALQNFSSEVVQEFQISLANFDPSTGIGSTGAINVVTRSGSNDYHGSAYIYGRHSAVAANPQLERSPIDPNPRFDREQYGGLASGPVAHDRLFWLASIDRTRQRGVSDVNAGNADLRAFNSINEEPFDLMLQTHRLDWNVRTRHRLNLRYSRDANQGRAGGGLVENQRINQNSSDQYVLNWNLAITPRLVNDYRIQFNKHTNYSKPSPESQEMGYPQVQVRQSNVRFGTDDNSPQATLLGRIEMTNHIAQQVGRHSLKYGASFERDRGRGMWQYLYPASISLYSPEEARSAGIVIPSQFQMREDVLRLPIAAFEFGVGNPEQPPYHPERSRINHRARFYFGDSWRIRSNLTLNAALAYSFEDNLVNTDLPRPKSLTRILNGNVRSPRRDWHDLSPMLGFGWSPGGDSKSLVRGGWGIYYDTILSELRLVERSYLAPFGVGYAGLSQADVPNPFNPSQSLDVITKGPTGLRGTDFMKYLPILRAAYEKEFAKRANNEDLSFTNLDALRTGFGILDPDVRTPYSLHYSLGFQRQLPHGVVVSVDGLLKQSLHDFFQADYNRFRRRAGPVDPAFQSVFFLQTGGTAQYKALVVRAEKRYSRRVQLSASYSFSSFVGLGGNAWHLGSDVTNNDNWKDAFGPQAGDRRHRLIASGTIDLPCGLQVAVISEATSRAPANLTAGNYDYDGDGTLGDRLPGTKQNQVNRSIHESDIPALVRQFNSTWSTRPDAQGTMIRRIPTLPAHYRLGDSMVSQDLRLTKTVRLSERCRLVGIGEVFNLFNLANLGGYSLDLSSPLFGQPTSRVSNVFGTGGPRAFQFALRASF